MVEGCRRDVHSVMLCQRHGQWIALLVTIIVFVVLGVAALFI